MLLEQAERTGHVCAVEYPPQEYVVRDAGVTPVGVGGERVRDEAETVGVHASLGEKSRFNDRYVVRTVVLIRLKHDHRVERVREPVPILAKNHGPIRSGRWNQTERRTFVRNRDGFASPRRVHNLRAYVDGQYVEQIKARALRHPCKLLQILG